MWLRIIVLMVVLGGQAHAASSVSSPSAVAVDLADFVGDPKKWMDVFAQIIGENHVVQILSKFTWYIVSAMAVYTSIFKGFMRQNWNVVYMTLFRSLLALAVLSGGQNGTGPMWTVIDSGLSTWSQVYQEAASIAAPKLEAVTSQSSVDMANAVQDYLMTAGAASSIADTITNLQFKNVNNPLDDSTVQSLVTDVMNARKKSPLESANWIVQLGYLIILGFFAVYTAIIAGSGLTIVLTSAILPFGVGAYGVGDGKMLKWMLISYIGAWATVLFTPFIMVGAAELSIKLPQNVLTAQIKNQTADLGKLATQYRDDMQTCQSAAPTSTAASAVGIPDWLSGRGACIGMKSFFIQIQGGLSSFYNLIRGFILFVIALIIGQAIGAAQLRRVPSYLGQALMTGIDATAHQVGAIGMGAAARVTGGALNGISRPTQAIAKASGSAIVAGANFGAAGASQAATAARTQARNLTAAHAISTAANNMSGQSARQQYSNGVAHLHPSNGTQTGPSQPYQGNYGNMNASNKAASGTVAGVGKTTSGKKP
ncbi:hypothetical protein Dxin01_00774 [Deinococcus xinjiangensis]|uniref:TrbL/VirB6 plasmid conjugal transfer protein n=1 Tax=Deinococcus xinjiangensis TaxID=457454 RepID=A0ABP9V6Y4_9DEIO